MLFVKHPTPGRVKTRLAATTGPEEAARIARVMVEHVCRQLPPRTDRYVFFDPPDRRAGIEAWLTPLVGAGTRFVPQSGGDLGERLECAFAEVFAGSQAKTVVIGGDCVELTPTIFTQAFDALDRCDCVIGPSRDGGYYLLGLTRLHCTLFREIEWSTGRTLQQTLDRASLLGLKIELLDILHDVDTADDWMGAQAIVGTGSTGPKRRID